MKDMLTDNDIARIGVEVGKVIEDNVNPRFEAIEKRLDGVEQRLDGVEGRLTSLETGMVTKDFLERRLAKTDGKINILANILEKKDIITAEERETIRLA